MTGKGKTHGTAVLTCKNHPTYRWVQTKYSLPDSERPYIGDGVLMFEGEEDGLPSSYWNMSEARLKTHDKAFQKKFRASHTPECDCDVDNLIFLRWAD